jgi:hypothetical protein
MEKQKAGFAMINNSKEINQIGSECKYSICTLVTDISEYEKMINSFQKKGFEKKNTEFLYINNINNNQYDAYSGLNHLLNTAVGEYVILCHQDILLNFDNETVLNDCLSILNDKDNNWALAGNAGGDSHTRYRRITDPHGTSNIGNFPQKVKSLDENFIIVNTKNRIALSGNLNGFHMYGTDMCIIADILGYTSYVINFHLQHNSAGNKDKSFYQAEKELTKKYQRSSKSRFIKSTCTKLFISPSNILTSLFNTKILKNILFLFIKIKKL